MVCNARGYHTLPVNRAAPEVLKENPATIKSDIFSFGVLMWEVTEVTYKVSKNRTGHGTW